MIVKTLLLGVLSFSWLLALGPSIGEQQAGGENSSILKRPSPTLKEGDQTDDSLLGAIAGAASQADSWTDALMHEQLSAHLSDKAPSADASKLISLKDQIDSSRRSEMRWEESLWTIPRSELLPGEHVWQHVGTYVMVEGTGLTMRVRFPSCKTKSDECVSPVPDGETVSYVVQAPLDIKARILVERLRVAISNYSAVRRFKGEQSNDLWILNWHSAWFDARNILCRRSPGANYRDLNGDEQRCK